MDAFYQGNEAPELVAVTETTDEDHSYFNDLVCVADEDEKLWKPPVDPEPMFGFVDQIGTLILPPEDGFDAEDENATTNREGTESANPEPTNDGDKIPPNDKPEKKKKRKKRILDANLTNCRYEAVRRVSRRFGFREVGDDEECNLYWTDFSVSIERVVSMKKWQIWEDIDDVIIKVLMSGLSVLRHNYKTCFPQHVETSACFEILGFDIMLDRKLRPYVIEVNHSPSFHTDAQIDKEIKEALIWDTLQLANFAAVDRRKCVEEDRRRIKERLLKRPLQKNSREGLDRDMEYYAQMAEAYENEHLGNFRRIFPSSDSAKYEKFLTANASLYQETAAFKARFEYSK
nr:unnamed protein product [Spirometra erinaceieuropaei]